MGVGESSAIGCRGVLRVGVGESSLIGVGRFLLVKGSETLESRGSIGVNDGKGVGFPRLSSSRRRFQGRFPNESVGFGLGLGLGVDVNVGVRVGVG